MCILYVGVLYFREFLLSVYSNDKRAVGWRRGDVFLPATGAVTSGHEGMPFQSSGGNDGHAGVLHKFSRVAGAYPPPNMWSKGGIL